MPKPSKLPALSVDVGQLHTAHPRIRASDWRSPLVYRLLAEAKYRDGSKDVVDSFRPTNKAAEQVGTIQLHWKGLESDYKQCTNTYQAPVLTEFATLALACVLSEKRAGKEVTEVTMRGEKVDYWLGDKELVLEVSGTCSGNLETLWLEKEKQLRANPFGKPGYVCVARYDDSTARLWFCK